jgi:hypothetical protein
MKTEVDELIPLTLEGEIFNNGSVRQMRNHLSDLKQSGAFRRLEEIHRQFLSTPDSTKAAELLGFSRSFNLFCAEIYASFNVSAAQALIDLGGEMYHRPALLDELAVEAVQFDIAFSQDFLSKLENIELFPADFQCFLLESSPHLLANLKGGIDPEAGCLTERYLRQPVRCLKSLQCMSTGQRCAALADIEDQALADSVVRHAVIEVDELNFIPSQAIRSAFLEHALL